MATVRSNRENDYIRLLGMSETGKSYLNQYKKAFSLPVVTREAELRHYGALASLDQRATACYWLTKPGALHSEAMKQEFQATPLFLKKTASIRMLAVCFIHSVTFQERLSPLQTFRLEQFPYRY